MRGGKPSLGTAERIALLRSTTLLHTLAKRLVLEEPSEAESGVLQRELLRRGRQLVAIAERGLPRNVEGEGVLTFKETRNRRLRRLEALLNNPEPPRAA